MRKERTMVPYADPDHEGNSPKYHPENYDGMCMCDECKQRWGFTEVGRMSTETQDLIRIVAVTDHDTGMYHMGEVDFRYNNDVLIDHVERYGADELLNILGFMAHMVWMIKLDATTSDARQDV